jgi:hypothetical protein
MKNRGEVLKLLHFFNLSQNLICLLLMRYRIRKSFHFVYPLGKPISPHLLCCQGLAVDNYSVALGRLKAGATSTFAQLGQEVHKPLAINYKPGLSRFR